MKLSNEVKIGALAVVAIACLIFGFNFLKGKSLFAKERELYAKYNNISGLQKSNPVFVNGNQIGQVFDIVSDAYLRDITVIINVNREAFIPTNSVASIKSNPLGSPSIEIALGNTTTYLKDIDTVLTKNPGAGILDAAMDKLDPVLGGVKKSLNTLDSLLLNVNSVVDGNAKANLQTMLANLNKTTANLTISSAQLNGLLNNQTGALAKTLDNVSNITGNFAKNNEKINSVMSNLDVTTTKLSKLDLEKTLETLNATVSTLKETMGKLNSTDGTIGLMLNDTRLYNNLTATTNKLNTLLDDVRTHPKRYINVSVFGKKDKRQPLQMPLPDTVNAPYLNK